MVCVYCGSPTTVSNSRLQRRNNHTWRRRKCLNCRATFTTGEAPDLSSSFMVKDTRGKLIPFNRDKLFIALYESCRHRPKAYQDATALTETVISHILDRPAGSVVDRGRIIETAHKALKRFDSAAATIYLAYHPIQQRG